MQTNCCNWSFGTASAFHNITEESIPNNSHKLPTCCALICWVSVCGCGKDNVTYGKSVICVRKKSVWYFANYCGYKCTIICGVCDVFRDLSAKLPEACGAGGCVGDSNLEELVLKKCFAQF